MNMLGLIRTVEHSASRLAGQIALRVSNPNLPLSTWEKLLDISDLGIRASVSGIPVGPITALNQLTLMTCVKLLADDLSRHPIHLYRRTGKGREKVESHPALTLIRNPNPAMTPMVFRRSMWVSQFLWGNSFAQTPRDNLSGRPAQLWPLAPDRMQTALIEGERRYLYTTIGGEPAPLRQSQVFHAMGMTFDGVEGIPPFRYGLHEAVGVALAAEQHTASFFGNMGRPGLIISGWAGRNKEDKENFIKKWNEAYSGRKKFNVGVIDQGLTVTPLNVNNRDAELLGVRRFQKEEIAQWYGIPMHRLGDQQQRAQTSTEQAGREYVQYTLAPHATAFEQALDQSLLSESERDEFFFRHNLDSLERGNFAERMAGYQAAIGGTVMRPNEARRLEDLPDDLNGDALLVPLNLGRLDMIGDLDQDEPAPAFDDEE